MKFSSVLTLLGAVGKKGSGKLDNGQDWSTDRVELHTLSEFQGESNAVGQTVTVYKIEDYAANFEKAKSCIGQRIVCEFEMQTSTKPGVAPKVVLKSFAPEKVQKAG